VASGMKITQTADYPHVLHDLVKRCEYRPGWSAELVVLNDRQDGGSGLTLVITSYGLDTYDESRELLLGHQFQVPAANYTEQVWRKWLFERFLDCEIHECAEFFQIDGERPYAPHHGPGHNPYFIYEYADESAARMRADGGLNASIT
jgi:hypothetical protein